MLIYATADDLVPTWLDLAPTNVDAQLRIASGIVRRYTRAALYDVDAAGKPSDPEIVESFTMATCAQVAYWVNAEIDPTSAGAGKPEPTIASKNMADRSVSYADPASSVTVAQARARAARELCDEARQVLSDAGLLNGQPDVI